MQKTRNTFILHENWFELFPPFELFSDIQFWLTDPKIFRRQYILFLRGERAPKKRDFLVKLSQKVPKIAFWACFFKFCLRRRNFGHNRENLVLWERSETDLVHLKKGRQKFEFFSDSILFRII